MSPTIIRRTLAAALALLPVTAAAQNRAQGHFELVGRGPITHTRTTDLAVFKGVDGRDYAYHGTFGACPGCSQGRMYVWDVTDPAHPRLTDSLRVDALTINDVAVNAAGTLAVLTREGAPSRRNGIVVLDLKDPAHPRPVGEYWETLTGGAHNVWLDGDKAYVVDQGGSELAIIDLAMPNDPIQVGRWGIPNSPDRFLQDVAVKDGLAYLSYWNDGLVILDVGNGIRQGTMRRPKLVGQYRYRVEWRGNRYGNTAYAFPYTNAAGNKYVFVGDQIMPRDANLGERFDTGGYVHVVDMSDPALPKEVAAYSAPASGVHSFWIQNDTMYVAAWSGGIRVVDVSGRLNGDLRGREIASLTTSDDQAAVRNFPFAWAAVPHNGLVFASDFNSGLWIARLVPGSTAATP